MIDWKYIAAMLCIFLLLFLIIKEGKRKNKSHLFWRMFATVTAVTSLACLAFPVTYITKENGTTNNEAIILTTGYNRDSVLKFLSNSNSQLPVITLDKNIDDKHEFNVSYVPDIQLLAAGYKNINTFHIFGFGFNKEELASLHGTAILFHPNHLTSGITSVSWTSHLQPGEKLLVQGTYNNASSAKTKLIISRFNTVLDSTYIESNKKEAFSLTVLPKAEGRTTYLIAAVTNNDTVEKETIPAEVEQGKKICVLMLSSSPDFDAKFLKNNFSDKGYSVAARTTISKNKYASDYVNMPAVSLENINASVLNKFDVLIADATALSSLSKLEGAIIQSAVAQKNMGLVIKCDSSVSSSFFSALFPVSWSVRDSARQLTAYLLDSASKLPALFVANSFFIRNKTNTQPLVQDNQNKVYVSLALFGSGKILFTTLTNTYAWALSGHENAYNQFWSTLLNKATTPLSAGEDWSVSPLLPVVNTPVQINLQTNSNGLPQGQVNGASVYLKRNPDLPYEWSGRYYPEKKGWQIGIGLNGKPWYWYAYNKTDWQNVYHSQKIIATEQYISTNLYEEKNGANQIKKQTELRAIYFYLLFLISCGYLWWESKSVEKL